MSDQMRGFEINIQKLLEGVWGLKTREKTNTELLHSIDEDMKQFKNDLPEWKETQTEIQEKICEIEEQYDKSSKDIKTVISKSEAIHKRTMKNIQEFVDKYTDGFNRIVKCEIEIRKNQLNIRKLHNDAKDKHVKLQGSYNFDLYYLFHRS